MEIVRVKTTFCDFGNGCSKSREEGNRTLGTRISLQSLKAIAVKY